jgi:hypothetical protein
MKTGWRAISASGRPPPCCSDWLCGGKRRLAAISHGDQREADQRGIRGEVLRLRQVARDLADGRADEAADDAAGQRQRDGAALPVGRRHFRRGEAQVLAEGLVDAGAEGGGAEQPEALQQDRQRADGAAQHAAEGAEDEAGAAAVQRMKCEAGRVDTAEPST